ncbi:MAG: 2-hydroxyacyl-CoA dehydratase [Desulfobacteraceae bacterium]|jgi:bcr-type benzoyl-CoA reductase subunit C|nr:MAG: 2-hydroxyacyl-CoA dehydratase [Desulfobacteraceae bacterium]
MEVLDQLEALASENPNSAAKAWKDDGKKIVGYWCSYVPQELMHAAHVFPYRIRGTGARSTGRADVYMAAVCNCTYPRAALELALDGTYDFIDGMVGANECDHGRRAYEIWVEKKGIPFHHFLFVPHKIDDSVLAEFQKELLKFKVHLENRFHTFITDDALFKSIRLYNENRRLLKTLQEGMKKEQPLMKGSELNTVIVAGVCTPPEQYNQLLKQLLEDLRHRKPMDRPRARLMIYGWIGDNSGFHRLVEDVGGLVVADNCCYGTRDFWEPVETDGDPLKGIARSYLYRPTCARMMGELNSRLAYAKNMIQEFAVDGVLITRHQFCDIHGSEAFSLKRHENEMGVPFSAPLIQEYLGEDAGRLKTRIEAFIEQIESN